MSVLNQYGYNIYFHMNNQWQWLKGKRETELENISVRISSKLNNLPICLLPTQPNPVQEPFKAEDFSKRTYLILHVISPNNPATS